MTSLTLCRPRGRISDGELDEAEVAQIEQLWRKCTRLVERFSGDLSRAHARTPQRTFLIRAVPVLDERDAVQRWAGIIAETDGLAEADTRFISEAAGLLSSSLNRTTILNRVAQASIDRFCDVCAIHTFADDGSVNSTDLPTGVQESMSSSRLFRKRYSRRRVHVSRCSCNRLRCEARPTKNSRRCSQARRRAP